MFPTLHLAGADGHSPVGFRKWIGVTKLDSPSSNYAVLRGFVFFESSIIVTNCLPARNRSSPEHAEFSVFWFRFFVVFRIKCRSGNAVGFVPLRRSSRMSAKRKYKTDHADPVVRRLEHVRERLGRSQRQMAEALAVPFRTYQKWIYSDQKPRHGAALIDRADAMLKPRRANCWDVLRCGREPGGARAAVDGPCPAGTDKEASGVNHGTNGGRICWAISDTFCGMDVEGPDPVKFISCFSCDFFFQVLQEEGLANFKLLKPGQTYTQT